MRPLVAFLLALAGVGRLVVCAPPDAEPTSAADFPKATQPLAEVREQIARLSSDDAAARTDATERLAKDAELAVRPLRQAVAAAQEDRRPALEDVLARVEKAADQQWLDRVRRLPEIWPGGKYKDTARGLTVEMKHERVQHEGGEALRFTDRWTGPAKDGTGPTSVTAVYLCRPDKYFTPLRVTAAIEGAEPHLDLTFRDGKIAGTKDGQKVEYDMPERCLLAGLLDQWIALMPFVPGSRERVTIASPGKPAGPLDVTCFGAADLFVNDKEQRVWTIGVRDPDDPDGVGTYVFSDNRRLQSRILGSTPMGEFVPAE